MLFQQSQLQLFHMDWVALECKGNVYQLVLTLIIVSAAVGPHLHHRHGAGNVLGTPLSSTLEAMPLLLTRVPSLPTTCCVAVVFNPCLIAGLAQTTPSLHSSVSVFVASLGCYQQRMSAFILSSSPASSLVSSSHFPRIGEVCTKLFCHMYWGCTRFGCSGCLKYFKGQHAHVFSPRGYGWQLSWTLSLPADMDFDDAVLDGIINENTYESSVLLVRN